MACLLTCSLHVIADDYGYLTFVKSDNTMQSLAVAGLTITFSDGNAVVQNGAESATLTLSELSKMYFSVEQETTGIESIALNPSSTGEGSEYYSLDGRKLNGKPTKTGVYIVKGNGITKKIAVK